MKTLKIITLSLILLFGVITTSSDFNRKNKSSFLISLSDYDDYSVESNPCLKMYEVIEKYSDEYSIPKHIIYNIAYIETKYHGPFDWEYKHNQGSYAGALGPMQVMPLTAKLIHKKRIPKSKLMNDIDFNVKTSAILLNKLYLKYKDWGKACGAYNTGRPIINKYSRFCTSNLSYWKNWYFFKEYMKFIY